MKPTWIVPEHHKRRLRRQRKIKILAIGIPAVVALLALLSGHVTIAIGSGVVSVLTFCAAYLSDPVLDQFDH